ncbi:Hypothetical predicted protein [Pelobates cultripes]|uniref:Uncharacterized protein n=1 Tax=Pelobates cultripes TaxID=61616 RepID=A0AAD1RHX3_PELCU|nr:Hypothetical predicted protein [Pelobates cultripes]
MGRKTKKQKADKPRMGLNISDMWRQVHSTAGPQMATYTHTYSELSDDLSLEGEMEKLPSILPQPPAPMNPDTSPVTTAVLKKPLADLQRNMLTGIRADLQGLRGQIGNLETTSNTTTQQIPTLQQEVKKLQQQQESSDWCFALLNDL